MSFSNCKHNLSCALSKAADSAMKFSPSLISTTLAILIIIRVVYFALAPIEYAVGGIADDTFYYQKLACNYVYGNGWSFDGETSTTGFHLLFAYLLVIFNSFLGCQNWRLTFLLIGVIASISISFSCYFTLKSAKRFFGRRGVLAGTIPFISPTVFLQATSLMESWM